MDKDKKQKVFTSDKFRSSSFESEAKKSTLSKTSSSSVGRGKPIDIEKLKEVFAKRVEADTANIREVLSGERGIEKEILGKNSFGAVFSLDVLLSEKKKYVLPESTMVTSKEVKWYPYENTNSTAGKITEIYLQALTDAVLHETEAFRFLSIAEACHKTIDCKKTIRIWKRLNTVISMCSQLELNEVACDVASYLRYDPESLSPYLKCFRRLEPHIKPTSEALDILEKRITDIASNIEIPLAKIKSHQDKTLKFTKQVSNVFSNLACLQEMVESVLLKISKLDLLLSKPLGLSTIISSPATPTSVTGEVVEKISLLRDGDYTGLYRIKVLKGKVVNIVPPSSNPELSRLITHPAAAQEVILNLDQEKLLNKMAAYPNLKEAFILEEGIVRCKILTELWQGIPEKRYQWIKT